MIENRLLLKIEYGNESGHVVVHSLADRSLLYLIADLVSYRETISQGMTSICIFLPAVFVCLLSLYEDGR